MPILQIYRHCSLFSQSLIKLKYASSTYTRFASSRTAVKSMNNENQDQLAQLIEKHEDKIIFNSIIDRHQRIGYKKTQISKSKLNKQNRRRLQALQEIEPLPLCLKYLVDNEQSDKTTNDKDEASSSEITHFPYESTNVNIAFEENSALKETSDSDTIYNEIKSRQTLLKKNDYTNWMTDYENYKDDLETVEVISESNWEINYGTTNPNSFVSNVPCGGCGALLHCKDTAIPGYIPSEIYENHRKPGGLNLNNLICQRCHFMKQYDVALQVRVSPEDYPKVLETIKRKRALIILVIDLTDFPCSVWPNIAEILGKDNPIVVVGNKVDLLPADSKTFLKRVQSVLEDSVREVIGNASTNILHFRLVSAKTGWGMEELITDLHRLWKTRGDVYLVGCTNVGKSSIFNTLLQSDYCKAQATDLIQRATTSRWPGTTLNLLKFPIMRPTGWRLFIRTKRLQSLAKLSKQEDKLRKLELSKTKNPESATLIGHIDRTFSAVEPCSEGSDPYAIRQNANISGKNIFGIDESHPDYALSKWCFDTPGVVQPNQIIHLLTAEELLLTLPRQLIRPRTFSIRPRTSLFIAGLGRLDFVTGSSSIRLTVFAADTLPITVCHLEDADHLYKELVGSDLLKVPKGNEERMAKWPNLQATYEFEFDGETANVSCADIVLSNAGWISITADAENHMVLRAWTPERRGICLRKSLLPNAVQLRGRKIRRSIAYKSNKFYIK